MARARTIANLWRDAVAAAHPEPAYLHEVDGEWRGVTWAEAARTVDEIANGLLALGVRKGDAFGLLARTNLEWSLFDFALALVGAVGAPIYASSSPRDTHYVLEHSEAVGVLVEDDEQRAKVAGSGVRHVISFSDLTSCGIAGARTPPSTRPRSTNGRTRSTRTTCSRSSTRRARLGRRRPA